ISARRRLITRTACFAFVFLEESPSRRVGDGEAAENSAPANSSITESLANLVEQITRKPEGRNAVLISASARDHSGGHFHVRPHLIREQLLRKQPAFVVIGRKLKLKNQPVITPNLR